MSTDIHVDPPERSAPRVRALRGATTAAADEPDAIVAATTTLLETMLARNDARPDDLISVVFTATDDLTAEFPAAAARSLGLAHVPLLCAREMAVPGDVGRCIRVLMHLYTDRDYASLRHVYLDGARQLRTDLPE
ncbi:MAG TPA: chorismate mutase [Actinomycetota bacterium]|nr:chorismate mutase [Actinomycetota bacterium]